ncbi:hypothetical protein KEM60_03167 [Austwickia sp. TVS 96-490-7B]|nr:hypothetical protein [Austwickia sp. TVS 96-490-7B]
MLHIRGMSWAQTTSRHRAIVGSQTTRNGELDLIAGSSVLPLGDIGVLRGYVVGQIYDALESQGPITMEESTPSSEFRMAPKASRRRQPRWCSLLRATPGTGSRLQPWLRFPWRCPRTRAFLGVARLDQRAARPGLPCPIRILRSYAISSSTHSDQRLSELESRHGEASYCWPPNQQAWRTGSYPSMTFGHE